MGAVRELRDQFFHEDFGDPRHIRSNAVDARRAIRDVLPEQPARLTSQDSGARIMAGMPGAPVSQSRESAMALSANRESSLDGGRVLAGAPYGPAMSNDSAPTYGMGALFEYERDALRGVGDWFRRGAPVMPSGDDAQEALRGLGRFLFDPNTRRDLVARSSTSEDPNKPLTFLSQAERERRAAYERPPRPFTWETWDTGRERIAEAKESHGISGAIGASARAGTDTFGAFLAENFIAPTVDLGSAVGRDVAALGSAAGRVAASTASDMNAGWHTGRGSARPEPAAPAAASADTPTATEPLTATEAAATPPGAATPPSAGAPPRNDGLREGETMHPTMPNVVVQKDANGKIIGYRQHDNSFTAGMTREQYQSQWIHPEARQYMRMSQQYSYAARRALEDAARFPGSHYAAVREKQSALYAQQAEQYQTFVTNMSGNHLQAQALTARQGGQGPSELDRARTDQIRLDMLNTIPADLKARLDAAKENPLSQDGQAAQDALNVLFNLAALHRMDSLTDARSLLLRQATEARQKQANGQDLSPHETRMIELAGMVSPGFSTGGIVEGVPMPEYARGGVVQKFARGGSVLDTGELLKAGSRAMAILAAQAERSQGSGIASKGRMASPPPRDPRTGHQRATDQIAYQHAKLGLQQARRDHAAGGARGGGGGGRGGGGGGGGGQSSGWAHQKEMDWLAKEMQREQLKQLKAAGNAPRGGSAPSSATGWTGPGTQAPTPTTPSYEPYNPRTAPLNMPGGSSAANKLIREHAQNRNGAPTATTATTAGSMSASSDDGGNASPMGYDEKTDPAARRRPALRNATSSLGGTK